MVQNSPRIPLLPLLAAASLTLGCAASAPRVALRSDGTPESMPCPREALEAMKVLLVETGSIYQLVVDINQDGHQPVRLVDGPVVGLIDERGRELPHKTRLNGYVWTAGRKVTVRYHEAVLPDGRHFPICATLYDHYDDLNKLPGSTPGVALIEDSIVSVHFVDEYP